MGIVKCSECQKSFSALFNLRKHAKKFHPDNITNIVPKKQYPYSCKQCSRNFSHLRDLKYHEKKSHSLVTSLPSSSCEKIPQCSFCQFQAPKVQLLVHFEKDHNIKITSEHRNFGTFKEFLDWKKNMEATSHSLFVKERGNFSTKQKDKTIVTYSCHRSGYFSSKGKGLRHLKSQGSKKINGFCPASLKVVIDKNDNCKVTFVDKHVGHENDLEHLTLTASEKELLARQMASKMSFTEILNQVRDSVHHGSNQLERIHLLTRRDLHNIEKSFNLQSTVVRNQNEATGVEAWIVEMDSYGCILFYKAQGNESVYHDELNKEDFVLIVMNAEQEEMIKKYSSDFICLDSTHGLNEYDLQLHTLLVLDDVKEAFPCAFLISNRSDEQVLKIFYNYVMNKIGYPIACKVFMSDMAEAYYSAWQQVMGSAEFRLFSTWNVDENWRNNLSKIKDKEKRVVVYKQLRTILQETDVREFLSMTKQFESSMTCDPDTAHFAEYFRNSYFYNTQSWAYCHRLHSGLNTNTHLEQMHRTIKYIYFNGQKVKRFDKAIYEIQKSVRDRTANRLIVLNNGNLLSNKLKKIRARHKASEKLSSNSVVKNGDSWEVSSSSPGCFEIYTIEENETNFICNCKLICDKCNVCIHRYSCTCIDACIRWNMCKHVHLVCKHLKEIAQNRIDPMPLNSLGLGDDSSSAFFEIPADDEGRVILTGLSNTEKTILTNKDELFKEKENIIRTLIPHLIQVAENITCMEQVHAFKKLCAPIAPTLKAIGNKQNKSKT